MFRYQLLIEYVGTNFRGWQIQKKGSTIQGLIQEKLTKLLKEKIILNGSGRTDTGVHARQMFAHFDSEITADTFQQLVYQLNQFLPEDIVIHSLRNVKVDAHARFDALSRTYEYHIVQGKTAFGTSIQYRLNMPLDIALMNAAATILLTYEDFECFSKSNTDVKTFLCDISYAKWNTNQKGYTFTITSNRFLRNMVRAIVGTLIEIGLKKKTIEDLHQIIASKNRSEAGYSVPAHGLFLTNIEYPTSIYI